MEAKNVDSTLVKAMNEQVNGVSEQPPVVESPRESAPVPEESQPAEQMQPSPETEQAPPAEAAKEAENEPARDAAIDEYGNPVEKKKMFSEDDVQRMIRERLSRVRNADTQQIKNEAENFKPDPQSEDNWEVQLENFIENTIEKRERKRSEQEWKRNEIARQAEFETKFTSGMTKYPDFREVVAGKPITDSMMMAARSLENPAAFVYGASKMHPAELDRIAKIADPYVQSAEVGRLHERMIKERKIMSNASKPLEAPRADMPAKLVNQPSIEERINQYAKQKRK